MNLRTKLLGLGLLLWLLLAASIWLIGVPEPIAEAPVNVPLGPRQGLRLWLVGRPQSGYGLVKSSFYHTGSGTRSLWLGVWYQDRIGGTTTRLLALSVPVWLLLLMPCSMAM